MTPIEAEIRGKVHDENDTGKPWAISGEDAAHLIELLDESRTEHARAEKELDEALARVEVVAGERDEARRERDEYGKQLEAFREWKAKACRLEAALREWLSIPRPSQDTSGKDLIGRTMAALSGETGTGEANHEG